MTKHSSMDRRHSSVHTAHQAYRVGKKMYEGYQKHFGNAKQGHHEGTQSHEHKNPKFQLLKGLAGSDAVTYSHFAFHPRHRKQRYGHNKFTCTSGTVLSHNQSVMQSNVARTSWVFREVMNFPNFTTYSKIMPFSGTVTNSKRQALLTGGTVVTSSVDMGVLTKETINEQGPTSQAQVKLEWYKHQFKIINRNSHPCWVDLWDIVLKESPTFNNLSSVDPVAASGILQTYFPQNEGNGGFFYGSTGAGAAADPIVYDHPDFTLRHCKQFSDAWTTKKHTRVRLMPGEEHIHAVFAKPNFVYDNYGIDKMFANSAYGGITQGTLIRAVGDVVHAATAGLPTIDGTILDLIEVIKVKISQVDPWRDIFDYNLSPAYPQFNATRDQVKRVELEQPSDAAGTLG